MKSLKVLLLSSALFSSIIAYAGNLPGYTTVFNLDRTLNSNQVVYEVNLSNQSYPVHPYWVMRAEDGHIEELNRIERSRAYGVEVTKQSSTELEFVVVSFRSHPITVRLDPDTQLPYATMVLSSGEKILRAIYLTASGGLFPTVSKIDIFYQDTKNGPVLVESFDPRN